jgi:hypothetical protein
VYEGNYSLGYRCLCKVIIYIKIFIAFSGELAKEHAADVEPMAVYN